MYLSKTDTNVGSVCKIQIADTQNISSFPPIMLGQAESAPVMTGAAWEDIYFTRDSAHLTIAPSINKGSRTYVSKLRFRAPKISPNSHKTLEEFSRGRYVFMVTLTNGERLLLGTKDNPIGISASLIDAGENARDSNHYIVEAVMNAQFPAPVIN